MVSLRHQGLRSVVTVICLTALLTALLTASASAQRDIRRVARRDSDDLSKFLIETESRSTTPANAIWDTPTGANPDRVNIPALASLLAEFASDTARLYQQLDAGTQYNPRLRSVLSDSLKLRARSVRLAQDAQNSRDIRTIVANIRELDTDWRLLSYNIKQLPQVPRGVLTIVAALDRTDERIEEAIQIDPQLDRHALLAEVMAMRADLDNLIDDLSLELGNTPKSRELVRNVRSIRQHAVYAAELVSERGDYKSVVEAYRRAETAWKPVHAELAQIDNRYIERSLRRIASAANEVRKLLWLESQADVSQLIDVADGMRKKVDEFFVRTPLLLILKLDAPHDAIDAANDFLDACDVYSEQVRLGEEQDVLIEVFKDLDVTGQSFVRVFGPLPSRAGQLVLADIRRDLSTLKELAQSHYMGDGFDRRKGTELAAEMETLAGHVDFDLRHWLRNSNDARAATILRISLQFVQNTQRLHASMVSQAPREDLRQQTSAVYENWRVLSQYLRQAPEEDREHLNALGSKLTLTLYDLMLPLGL